MLFLPLIFTVLVFGMLAVGFGCGLWDKKAGVELQLEFDMISTGMGWDVRIYGWG